MLAGDVAGFVRGAGPAEAVQVERVSLLELEAGEAVAGLQGRILRRNDLETVLAQVFNYDATVRQPAEQKLSPGSKG